VAMPVRRDGRDPIPLVSITSIVPV